MYCFAPLRKKKKKEKRKERRKKKKKLVVNKVIGKWCCFMRLLNSSLEVFVGFVVILV